MLLVNLNLGICDTDFSKSLFFVFSHRRLLRNQETEKADSLLVLCSISGKSVSASAFLKAKLDAEKITLDKRY